MTTLKHISKSLDSIFLDAVIFGPADYLMMPHLQAATIKELTYHLDEMLGAGQSQETPETFWAYSLPVIIDTIYSGYVCYSKVCESD